MAKATGFLEHERKDAPKRSVEERIRDHREIEQPLPPEELTAQAVRCMDCGVPFCHAVGCPLGNVVPEWNEMVYRGRWREALELLHSTNNFPEITGRVCPAPCEAACTLAINQEPVTIRQIELQVCERGWEEGWIRPRPAAARTGRRAAVVGSGPAALVAAQQLVRAGHEVVVFEKADKPGGILRYGIPDFKLEKWVLERRLDQMRQEGVAFETSVNVGADISARYLLRTFDAVFLALGCRAPRDIDVPGRGLEGIHFAMPFLTQQNRRNAGEVIPADESISAEARDVVVIGGGDTGADCVGTARRQGARRICQIELFPEPPPARQPDNPWPTWPQVLRSGSSHEEGCERLWSVQTEEFLGREGRVCGLRCVRLNWSEPDQAGRRAFEEVPGSGFELKAELVLLALGFVHAEHGALVEELGLDVGPRGHVAADERFCTNVPGVFAAGDCVSGASLVVRAFALGRQAAEAVDRYLRAQP
ncbi:MAG: glutamate synthase subunit beta [Planctomycetota bacterium]|jgi:NAD(P)H-dependent glutamate synthase small subunit